MANYSVNRAKHATLVAATVDTVSFVSATAEVEVVNRGTDDIYYTVDGSTPTVGGDDTYIVRGGEAVGAPKNFVNPLVAQVKLMSSGSPAYSVEANR